MAKNTNQNELILISQADKSVIPAGKTGERILELQLSAPPAEGDRPHVPLNLALVLDRSGSMHGDKLAYVKEAALHVVDLMTEADRVTLVIYDDKVETLMPSQYLTPQVKQQLKEKIRRIRSGGSTFLYGGWVTGSRQVAEALAENTFNRTLLLTDGLANVGVRDVGVISMHAQELFMRGISSSCFGVGEDYDEHFLEAIANLGGGNFHFLETLQAIPLEFEREFDEIISLVLKDLKITLTLPKGVKAAVSGNWHTQQDGNKLEIFLGSLVAEQKQAVYIKLSQLKAEQGQHVEIPFVVTGVDLDQKAQEVKGQLTLLAVSEKEEFAAPQDADLLERFAEVDLADKANEALKLERAGDRTGSSRMMRSMLSQHGGHISEGTRDKYDRLSSQMMMGMDEAERKRQHYQAYQNRRGTQSIRDYVLRFEGGAMMTDIEGLQVLIDTAAAVSIGRDPDWFFLDLPYKLPQSDGGRTCDAVSTEVGRAVDVVLGMDILQNLYLQLDPDRHVITFSRDPLRSHGWRLDLDIKNGKPTCKMTVAGKELTMQLMTSTRKNFVPEALPQGFTTDPKGVILITGSAAAEGTTFHAPITFGEKSLSVKFSSLTPNLGQKLGLEVGEGILGTSFFEALPVTLAFPERELVIYI